jgi:hypothetical protein
MTGHEANAILAIGRLITQADRDKAQLVHDAAEKLKIALSWAVEKGYRGKPALLLVDYMGDEAIYAELREMYKRGYRENEYEPPPAGITITLRNL